MKNYVQNSSPANNFSLNGWGLKVDLTTGIFSCSTQVLAELFKIARLYEDSELINKIREVIPLKEDINRDILAPKANSIVEERKHRHGRINDTKCQLVKNETIMNFIGTCEILPWQISRSNITLGQERGLLPRFSIKKILDVATGIFLSGLSFLKYSDATVRIVNTDNNGLFFHQSRGSSQWICPNGKRISCAFEVNLCRDFSHPRSARFFPVPSQSGSIVTERKGSVIINTPEFFPINNDSVSLSEAAAILHEMGHLFHYLLTGYGELDNSKPTLLTTTHYELMARIFEMALLDYGSARIMLDRSISKANYDEAAADWFWESLRIDTLVSRFDFDIHLSEGSMFYDDLNKLDRQLEIVRNSHSYLPHAKWNILRSLTSIFASGENIGSVYYSYLLAQNLALKCLDYTDGYLNSLGREFVNHAFRSNLCFNEWINGVTRGGCNFEWIVPQDLDTSTSFNKIYE